MFEYSLNNQLISNIINLSKALGSDKTAHLHGSFGDIYCQLSVINEYNFINENKINILIDESYSELIKKTKSDKLCKVFFTNSNGINSLLSNFSVLGINSNLPIRMLPTVYPMIPELINEAKIAYIDFLRLLIGSKVEGKLRPIESDSDFEDAKKILHNNDLPIGKTVLLTCDHNTHQEFSEEFWFNLCNFISNLGLTPCLNASGTLNSGHKILNQSNIKRIKIPPHLAISLPAACGFFIGSTCGFQALQGFFNNKCICIHLVNAESGKYNYMKDKFGNIYLPKNLLLSIASPQQKLDTHLEFIVESQQLGTNDLTIIKKHLISLNNI